MGMPDFIINDESLSLTRSFVFSGFGFKEGLVSLEKVYFFVGRIVVVLLGRL